MKKIIYKVNDKFVSADNSTDAIRLIRKPKQYLLVKCDLVVDTANIISSGINDTTLYLVDKTTYITGHTSTDAHNKYNKGMVLIEKICLIKDIIA